MALCIEDQKRTELNFRRMKRHHFFSKELFHKDLIRLRKMAKNNKIPRLSNGICANVEEISSKKQKPCCYSAVAYYARKWEEHSGERSYPVGFSYAWDGVVGAKRLRLLDYLIEKTK
jgi:hypothetical protein